MQKAPDAGRAAPLVLELSSGTAILHGEGVELPLREFRLLAALARRAPEPVSSTELIEAIWPDQPWTPKENLYVLASQLRRLIDGPTKFGKNIRNRRGFGYMLDLAPRDVVVIESGMQESLEDRANRLDEAGDHATDAEAAEAPYTPEAPSDEEAGEVAVEGATRSTGRPRGRRLAGIAALALILLVGSWSAGYVLSKVSRSESKDEAKSPEGNQDSPITAPAEREAEGNRADKDARSKTTTRNKDSAPRGSQDRGLAGVGGGATSGSNLANQDQTQGSQGSRKGSQRQPSEPALPPAPTRYLYHLVNEKTGDHVVTTDGSTASEYEAMGYEGGAIARVYTYEEDDTKAISTNHGTAYIFVTSSPKTDPASVAVTLWYSTNDDGDFFYTTRESEAKQDGWQASMIGYVRSL
ncbi:MAG: winged helix-turn-helix domain-containing protein [Actinomycetota bacterium]